MISFSSLKARGKMRKVKCSKANIALSPIIMYNKTVCKQPKAGEGFMQKIKDFCKRHRLLWLTLLVALAAAAVAAWAGFDLGSGWITSRCMKSSTMIIPVPL